MNPPADAVPADILSPGVLAPPAWLVDSAWHQHGPFAAWVVEAARPDVLVELGTHGGFSYFALCQAVAALDLPTRCFAVDHWRGDSFTGAYGDEVFAGVNGHNAALYPHFSTLLRRGFDEALPEFADGSVDLLHIDGDHTYDAAMGDFESWLPKMSARGVVLMHDTAEYGDGYEVARVWREVSARYPAFAFPHGHGLGVVLVGSSPPEPFARLVEAGDGPAGAAVRQWYARLGQAVSAEWELRALRSDLAGARAGADRAGQERAAAQAEAARLAGALGALRDDERAEAVGRLLEVAGALERCLAGAADTEVLLRRDVDAVLAAAARSADENAVLRMRLASAEQAVASLAEAASAEASSAEASSAGQAVAAPAEAAPAPAAALAGGPAGDPRLHDAEEAAAVARRQLEEVYASTAWRVTAPLRALGTARRRAAGRRR